MDANHDMRTLSQILSISSMCFCSCWAHQEIRSDLDVGSASGTGTRNVASAKSNGNSGSMPCTIKYGESPVDLRIVTCSVQKTE